MTDTPIERGFLLVHGWQNHRPAGHWQHWLADRLTGLGHRVDYPQLPDPDHPDLERWLAELRTRVRVLRGQGLTVICHSLACMLWLHAVARDNVSGPVARVLLVAPPSPATVRQNAAIAAFSPPFVTAVQVTAAAKHTRIIGGDNDPYCPEGALAMYGEPLGLPTDILVGAAHLDQDAGYGSWPSLLDWCLEPSDHTPIRHRTEPQPPSAGSAPALVADDPQSSDELSFRDGLGYTGWSINCRYVDCLAHERTALAPPEARAAAACPVPRQNGRRAEIRVLVHDLERCAPPNVA
jgi:predicted alpha/beta hydrolase family esterase